MNKSKKDKFIQYLEDTTNIVRKLPKWQRLILGAATPEDMEELNLMKLKEKENKKLHKGK